ncbi:hypothetical protein SEPCBS119000_003500 [Sporothrix epigloea]|uniref:Inner centromere protein ARK-binding domain-containing protein n=1 Tax=Sporothrix epigloea TaxID=1892477 RepID=A0ABP0DLZ8_9PEZI
MAMRGPRHPIGAAPWTVEERTTALQIAQSEIEEFMFSAKNELDWLNEHMADIFSENQMNVADIFKTPGKLRGKTPRTARKINKGDIRAPLTDVFSSTPKGAPNPFAVSKLTSFQQQQKRRSPTFIVAEDKPTRPRKSQSPQRDVPAKKVAATKLAPLVMASKPQLTPIVSHYNESRPQDVAVDNFEEDELAGHDATTEPLSQPARTATVKTVTLQPDEVKDTERRISAAVSPSKSQTAALITSPEAVPAPATPAVVSFDQASVSSTATTTQMAAIPEVIAKTRPAEAGAREEVYVENDVAIYEDDTAIADAVNHHDQGHQTVLHSVHSSEQDMEVDEKEGPPSPVRPVVRKSSMSFASLPARAPFTSNKSLGAGIATARTGQTELTQTTYFNRPTGGKSLGNVRTTEPMDEDERNHSMDGDGHNAPLMGNDSAEHSKTYAQRLHDRISMLGKSQANASRPSKSLAAFAQQQETHNTSQQQTQQSALHSPKKTAAPGASLADDIDDEDEDDDNWFDPSPAVAAAISAPMIESAETDTVAATHPAEKVTETVPPKQRHQLLSRSATPRKALAPIIPERTTSVVTVPVKSSSVPSLPLSDSVALATSKPISVSNPANHVHAALAAASENKDRPSSPSKSPSRNYRDSPLKHVKNKLSSILKTSRGLLASSAALSAEGKSLILSPSTTRVGLLMAPSTESLALNRQIDSMSQPAHPEASRQASAISATTTILTAPASSSDTNAQKLSARPESPVRTVRRTRASVEKEQLEQKRREKELKEAQRMAEQLEKLEAVRELEREKARLFAESQEKAMTAAAKPAQISSERHLRVHARLQQHEEDGENVDVAAPLQPILPMPKPQPSSPTRAAAKATRASPRKAKAQEADGDVNIAGASTTTMLPPPPSAQNNVSTTSAMPRSAQATRTIRRPIKPTKDAPVKAKQAPTVIRVTTSSSQHQQQQSQSHPSNNMLAASLHETLAGPPQLKNKTSTASLHTKASLPSLKSSISSAGRPKALELAAKRKEAEEKETQRKRDAKAEMERKRAIVQEQEERRQEQQRKREREREQAQAEAASTRKAAAMAQRQAAAENTKQTRAPPPVQRTQLPNGPAGDYGRSDAQPPRPQSRLATTTGLTMHRSQEEEHRPVNTVLSHTAKSLSKRPLPVTDAYESHNTDRPGTQGRGHVGGGSNLPPYQHKDAKRIRMSEEFDEDELEMGGHDVRVSSIKGPPVRPSNGFKKVCSSPPYKLAHMCYIDVLTQFQEMPNKSVFGNGYSAVATNASRDLFKSTVTAQHNNMSRVGHPMDMAQVSKATIPFAPGGTNSAASAAAVAAAASTSTTHNNHKTPLRPAGSQLTGKSAAKSAAKSIGKPAAKSSPRYPNGDAIELPDIQTDDEDSEEEHVNAAPWADSPDLRRALMRQETVDPFQVFGPPGPLNMEEVFSKTKERWHKYRARTSSANWSGIDRLTDDDIRKDLAARDKIRREGGWSYELGKDML